MTSPALECAEDRTGEPFPRESGFPDAGRGRLSITVRVAGANSANTPIEAFFDFDNETVAHVLRDSLTANILHFSGHGIAEPIFSDRFSSTLVERLPQIDRERLPRCRDLVFVSHCGYTKTWLPHLFEDRRANVAPEERSQVKDVDLEWLIAEPQSAGAPDKLRVLYRGMQHLLRREDYAAVDSLFKRVNIHVLPVETLVALLRYSFAAYRSLEGWRTLHTAVRDELARRRLDAGILLRGLEVGSAEQI